MQIVYQYARSHILILQLLLKQRIQVYIYTVKIECAYHTNGVIYGTMGVLITFLLLHSCTSLIHGQNNVT